jgi:hypothetical protein
MPVALKTDLRATLYCKKYSNTRRIEVQVYFYADFQMVFGDSYISMNQSLMKDEHDMLVCS